jgi:hypothetical protein
MDGLAGFRGVLACDFYNLMERLVFLFGQGFWPVRWVRVYQQTVLSMASPAGDRFRAGLV